MNRRLRIPVLVLGALASAAFAPAADRTPVEALDRLAGQVRHELAMMPYYGVFDSIAFRMDGRAVRLLGEVARPTLRDEAERRVKALEGVETVDNDIRILPLSPFDDRIRLASCRAIYAHPVLSRYGMGVQPGIRLVVEHGALTLKGVVATEFDRNLAGILANSVSGAFAVANELAVEESSPRK